MQRGLALVTFGAIYLVLLKSLHWKLILTQTTAAGGDMGSHHYVATFLREELLPRGRVSGWAPGWFAGIPMLTFYFPLPYVLIAALTLPLGDQVAFKLVTVLGLFLLPVTCWAAFRLLRLREPAPLLAACGATVFLFMNQVTPTEQFTIWGGNIASTMAGEFPFSISFALLPLALAVLWRVCEDGKGWRAAALLVSAVVLSHILTTIVLVLGVAVLVVRRPLAAALASFRRLALVMGVAFCLTAFWGLPFILRVQYTAHFRWRQLGDYSLLLPNEIRPYLLLTLVGLVVAVARGERRVLLFAWPAAAVAFVFVALIRVAPEAALWNARMLPFLYLFSLLVAAYGASVVAGWAAGWLQRWTGVSLRYAWLAVVAVMVVAPVVGAWRPPRLRARLGQVQLHRLRGQGGLAGGQGAVRHPGQAAPGPGHVGVQPRLRALRHHQDAGEHARVRRPADHGGAADRVVDQRPVPLHQPGRDLRDPDPGRPRHRLPRPDGLPDRPGPPAAVRRPLLRRLRRLQGPAGEVGALRRARPAGQGAAGGHRGRPAGGQAQRPLHHLRGRDRQPGRGAAVPAGAGRPPRLAGQRAQPGTPTRTGWRRRWCSPPPTTGRPAAAFAHSGPLPVASLPRERLERPGELAATTSRTGDVVSFRTDRVGEPHIVKVSWFPNWKVEGAQGPWLLSPGLMVVVPTQAEVRLSYGDTPVELAGKALTVAGVGALLAPTVLGRVRARRRKGP